MKISIDVTFMMIFALIYFGASGIPILNLPIDMDPIMGGLNTLLEIHFFEFCLVITAITSLYRNYKRTIQNNAKFDILKMIGLFGFDYSAMLLGVLASQLIFMVFNFSTNNNMDGFVIIFTAIIIILNVNRIKILEKLAQ